MSLRVCNRCGTRYADDPSLTCPQCLQAEGRVEIDHHLDHMDPNAEAALAAASSPGEGVGEEAKFADENENGIPDDDEDSSGEEEDPDSAISDEDLEQHSRNRLSSLARERGLDASGTKEDLLARLREEAQG